VSLDPYNMLASLAVSCVGFVLFSYGKRMRRAPFYITGIVMLVYPFFVSSPGWILGIAPGLLLLLWVATRLRL
jgi:hypothetical protein